ncbi:MAG: hypothetical protein PQJ59_15245 [Spirochaetales bacterium]|nr:hypothetical protein [Spirochaetales bacterium]
MKKISLVLIFLALILSQGAALDINDPSDNLYRDLEYWQELGFYRHLPEVRPYSAQLILSLLERVMIKDHSVQRQLALSYYEQINRGLRLDGELELTSGAGREGIAETTGSANFMIRGMIDEKVSVWGEVSANGIVEQEEVDYYMYDPSVPYGDRSESNVVDDISEVGGVALLQASTGMFSYGTENLYANIGVSRSSFGPYWGDSVVISSEASSQGHMELTWRKDHFSYTMLLLELVGTDYYGEGSFSEKYMALHSYNWAPFDWLDVGFFESVVWGERLEPLYLMPFTYFFYNQGMAGFDDNSLMGLKYRILTENRVEFNGILYVDDIGFNELIEADFDTKIKIAFETGASWTPARSWLDKINLDYTAVFPYMYTHGLQSDYEDGYEAGDTDGDGDVDYDDLYDMNCTNYSHNGENLGVTLSPNSDRISLSTRWRATPKTQFIFRSNWIRHGNASSENVDGDYDTTDGSLWDNGFSLSGWPDFASEFEFLTQDVLEKVLQFGVDMETSVALPFHVREDQVALDVGMGYTFERIWNSGRNSSNGYSPEEGDDELNHYFYLNTKLAY